jgi:archaeal type IV pilus assembly protein PilA
MIKDQKERAVSPVVGVMLMLVVVIIIAAVVSGFAGGLMNGQKKAPLLSLDTHIVNTGYWSGSHFSAQVTGVESAIPTSDLKIVTKWSHLNITTNDRTTGGATVSPNVNNVHVQQSGSGGTSNMGDWRSVAPWGYGLGVSTSGFSNEGSSTKGITDKTKFFGNYSLGVGTVMYAEPLGASTAPYSGGFNGFSLNIGYGVAQKYMYTTGSDSKSCKGSMCATFNPPWVTSSDPHIDGMMAVLGTNWSVLRPGDTVEVSIIHIPSGKTIYDKDVTVEG